MGNRKELTDAELDQVSGGTIDDSSIPEWIIFKHKHPQCMASFISSCKPVSCPACGRPDSVDGPIVEL